MSPHPTNSGRLTFSAASGLLPHIGRLPLARPDPSGASGKLSFNFDGLSVEPEVLETLAVVDAADHQRQPFQFGRTADRAPRVEQHRARVVRRQLLLDLPHQLFAL